MKVLYVASNPEGSESLRLEQEITELQRRFAGATGEPVNFVFLPSVKVEELAMEISRHRPEILHISAHGEIDGLSLMNAAEKEVRLTAGMLRVFLDVDPPPRLVYLNACDSRSIARELTDLVPMAIGTTAPITNRAARAAAVLFYDRLLQGRTIQNAFEASQAVIEAMEDLSATSALYNRIDIDPQSEIFYYLPRVVARFYEDKYTPLKDGTYWIEVALIGCPKDTVQVIFFTDDKWFISDKNKLPEDLSSIVRMSPKRGEIWSDEYWPTGGDFRLFACGVTASGEQFMTGSSVCDALELYQKLTSNDPSLSTIPKEIRQAIAHLRAMDGSELASRRTTSISSRSAPMDKGPMPKPKEVGATSKPNSIVQSPKSKSTTVNHNP